MDVEGERGRVIYPKSGVKLFNVGVIVGIDSVEGFMDFHVWNYVQFYIWLY